jgi:hypothetical protein
VSFAVFKAECDTGCLLASNGYIVLRTLARPGVNRACIRAY